jgi:hypothetical protein
LQPKHNPKNASKKEQTRKIMLHRYTPKSIFNKRNMQASNDTNHPVLAENIFGPAL